VYDDEERKRFEEDGRNEPVLEPSSGKRIVT